MYQTSKTYNEKIYSSARKFRGVIFLEDYVIDSNNDLISFEFSDEIYTDKIIGTFVAKTVKVTMFNTRNISLENKEFQMFLDLKVGEDETGEIFEGVLMGNYIITDLTVNKVKNTVTFNASDFSLKYNVKTQVSILGEFPQTIHDMIIKISDSVGVSVADGTNYTNMDFTFATQPYINAEWQWRDVIRLLAESCGCYAKINRYNELEIKMLDIHYLTYDDVIPLFDENVYKSISVEEKYGPVNSLVLAREPQGDWIFRKDDLSIEENGLTEIKIVNNMFIDKDRDVVIDNLFHQIKDFYYFPFTMDFQGNPAIESGDIIEIQYTDKRTNITENYITMVTSSKLNYTGGIKQTLSAKAMTKTEINYDYGTDLIDRITNTEIIVDKQTNEIKLIVEQVEKVKIPVSPTPPENPEEDDLWLNSSDNIIYRYVNLEWIPTSLDPNKLEDYVTIEKLGTELNQTIKDFNFIISSRGGNNLLKNSVGKNGIAEWVIDGKVPEIITSSRLSESTISMSAFEVINTVMYQEIKVNNGRTYTYTGRVSNNNNRTRIYLDDGINIYEVFGTNQEVYNEYTQITLSLEVGSNILRLIFESQDDESILNVSDSVISEGSGSQLWGPHYDEIYTTNVKIDNDGIEVGTSYSDIKSNITNREFAISRGSQKAISVSMDRTLLQKTVIEDDLQVGKLKMIVRNNRVDFIVLD